MPRLAVAMAIVLVCTAGCSSFGGGDEASRATVTPAPVPDDVDRPLPYPPGVNASGVTSITALSMAHRNAIRNRSYTFHERFVRTTDSEFGRTYLRENETAYVSDSRLYRNEVRRVQRSVNGDVRRYSQSTYGDAYVQYSWNPDGEVSKQMGHTRAGPEQFAYETVFRIEEYLAADQSTVEEVVRNDTRYVHVTGTGGRPRWEWLSEATQYYRVSVLIRPSGLVERMEMSYRTRTTAVRFQLRIENVGTTTVEKPAWVDGDRNSTR